MHIEISSLKPFRVDNYLYQDLIIKNHQYKEDKNKEVIKNHQYKEDKNKEVIVHSQDKVLL